MCTTLHPNELKRLQDAFKRLDRNGDGTITAREFQIACRQFNPSISEMEIRKLVGQMDIDGNGLIDFDEFCLGMATHSRAKQAENKAQAQPQRSSGNGPAAAKKKPGLSEKQMKDAFQFFDKDRSGDISPSEMRQVMTTLGIACSDIEFKAMISSIDDNGDGQINFEEFSTLLNSFF